MSAETILATLIQRRRRGIYEIRVGRHRKVAGPVAYDILVVASLVQRKPTPRISQRWPRSSTTGCTNTCTLEFDSTVSYRWIAVR